MRKSFIVFVVLFLLAFGVTGYAKTSLLQEKDQVQITETVVYGDKAAVEGVTVERNMKYGKYMRWNTVYTVGEHPKQDTVYTFDEFGGLRDDADYVPDGIEFRTTIGGGIDLAEATGKSLSGVNRAIWELFCETEPGTISSATINLVDYLDYYEYQIQIILPGIKGQFYEYGLYQTELEEQLAAYQGSNESYRKKLEEYLHIVEKMTEFFKIPLIENQLYQIAVAKGEDGKLCGWSYDYANGGGSTGDFLEGATSLGTIPENADSFDIWAICAYTDDNCYFTFEPYTRNGKQIDTSLITGGYGIYCLPYDKENGTIDVDNLAMVYALDPSENILDLYYDANKKELLLLQGKKNGYALTVIDETDMSQKQELIYTQRGYTNEYYVGDDFLVLTGDNQMFVLAVNEEGFYEKEFECEMLSFENDGNVFYPDVSDMTFDWNGEKLLIGGSCIKGYPYNVAGYYLACGFYLAAFDKNGLVYSGIYESSLDVETPYNINSQNDPYGNYNKMCRPTDVDSMSVSW